MPAKKMRSIKNPAQYEALRREGFSKQAAARITNSAMKKKRRKKRKP